MSFLKFINLIISFFSLSFIYFRNIIYLFTRALFQAWLFAYICAFLSIPLDCTQRDYRITVAITHSSVFLNYCLFSLGNRHLILQEWDMVRNLREISMFEVHHLIGCTCRLVVDLIDKRDRSFHFIKLEIRWSILARSSSYSFNDCNIIHPVLWYQQRPYFHYWIWCEVHSVYVRTKNTSIEFYASWCPSTLFGSCFFFFLFCENVKT